MQSRAVSGCINESIPYLMSWIWEAGWARDRARVERCPQEKKKSTPTFLPLLFILSLLILTTTMGSYGCFLLLAWEDECGLGVVGSTHVSAPWLRGSTEQEIEKKNEDGREIFKHHFYLFVLRTSPINQSFSQQPSWLVDNAQRQVCGL